MQLERERLSYSIVDKRFCRTNEKKKAIIPACSSESQSIGKLVLPEAILKAKRQIEAENDTCTTEQLLQSLHHTFAINANSLKNIVWERKQRRNYTKPLQLPFSRETSNFVALYLVFQNKFDLCIYVHK